MLLGRIRSHSWDEAITLYEEMNKRAIIPSPQTIQGLILAYYHKGGQSAVKSIVNSLLQKDGLSFTERTFRLVSKILFKEVDTNLDDFRKKVRDIGEEDSTLRKVSLNLIRSVRVAEIESGRPKTIHKTEEEMKLIRDRAWVVATSRLLEFVEAFPKN
mmetsp:Transcript_21483/g.34575  ORF Transcript_21483/g.34575 Transcript_21483/m.34575 type:complete len:158 (+) Transcript_21483:795-1268(+)